MCYSVSLIADRAELEARFDAEAVGRWGLSPAYLANAFDSPSMPVVHGNGRSLELMEWGLIPGYARDAGQAGRLSRQTANARSETVFEKLAFRESARSRRCLVPVTGFFETRHEKGKRYPYLVRLKEDAVFALAGVWSQWRDPDSGAGHRTYSVLTTRANPLMETIHNTKMRMPVILTHEGEGRWLDQASSREELAGLFEPFSEKKMAAHTVRRDLFRKDGSGNRPEALEPVDYPELASDQSKPF